MLSIKPLIKNRETLPYHMLPGTSSKCFHISDIIKLSHFHNCSKANTFANNITWL